MATFFVPTLVDCGGFNTIFDFYAKYYDQYLIKDYFYSITMLLASIIEYIFFHDQQLSQQSIFLVLLSWLNNSINTFVRILFLFFRLLLKRYNFYILKLLFHFAFVFVLII